MRNQVVSKSLTRPAPPKTAQRRQRLICPSVSNKELKLTKPSIMEIRSLTPVLARPELHGRPRASHIN